MRGHKPLTVVTMLGCAREELIAASITAIFCRLVLPLMQAGSRMVLTATVVPRHTPL